VDLRGYGPSDAPKDVDCYTTDLLMADIQDIILGLGTKQPPPNPGEASTMCTLPMSSLTSPTSASPLPGILAQHICLPGYSKCILVGHDWGAVLAWNFSIYFPSLVERMVVVSGPPMSVYQGVLGMLGCVWVQAQASVFSCGRVVNMPGAKQ
jgi:pimeloyl-ACP methyl ester carboxylesterase